MTDTATPPPVVTSLGALQGRIRDGVHEFLGVPYAAPPIGDLRFRPPQPPIPWDGTRSATHLGASAPQIERDPDSPLPATGYATNEDCLFLNVYTPAPDNAARPVLIWIHGGSYMTGRGATVDGGPFARNGDIVVVSINYRLGLLGFMELGHLDPELAGSHNNGIRDQIAALRWVHDNIAVFGGDPTRVTIAGESAGAGSVMAILASPEADDLYHQAISQSAPAAFMPPSTALAQEVLAAAGAHGVDELRSLPADAIIEIQKQLATATVGSTVARPRLPGSARRGIRPAIDGITVTRSPPEAAGERGIPLLLGTNLDEGTLFGGHLPKEISDDLLRSLAADHTSTPDPVIEAFRAEQPATDNRTLAVSMIGDTLFRTSSLHVADAAAAADTPVFTYLFEWQSTEFNGFFGSMHALEIPFVWQADLHGAAAGWQRIMGPPGSWPVEISDNMHYAWIGFVRDANPTHDGIGDWRRYDDTRPTMVFGNTTRLEHDPRGKTRASWDA
ncbi:MAG: carboxylesterase family protein [Actinobacteria bacterium]|nr:carboxylesterase family protein [Actinomycetota bacterium]